MGQLHELVIAKDQDIKAAIEAFVLEKGWQNVYISGAIGSGIRAGVHHPRRQLLSPPGGAHPLPGAG